MRGVGLALCTVVVLGVAACGGDGDGDTVATDPTVGAVTTESPTSSVTTAASTTAAPTTTAPPSTTTTTLAPTTTQDPSEILAAEVEAAYLDSWDLYAAAGQDPTNDRLVGEALDGFTGPARAAVDGHLQELVTLGQRLIPSETVEAGTRIVSTPTQVEGDPTRAALEECETDSWIVVEVAAGPGGSDAIVNDAVASYRNEIVMVSIDGAWLVESATEIDRWPEPWCGESS